MLGPAPTIETKNAWLRDLSISLADNIVEDSFGKHSCVDHVTSSGSLESSKSY